MLNELFDTLAWYERTAHNLMVAGLALAVFAYFVVYQRRIR